MAAALRSSRRTLVGVELSAYLGTVAGLVALAVGAMRVVVGQLGARMDEQRMGLEGRIDALGERLDGRIDDLGARMAHLEVQNDAIIGAVGDVAQRVAHLEGRGA